MSNDIPPELLGCLEGTPACVGLFDAQDRLRYANAAFQRAFDVAPGGAPTWEQMVRQGHARRRGLLIETGDIDAWLAQARRGQRRAALRSFEADFADGRWRSVTETVHDNGWCLVVATDVTSLKVNEATLQAARDRAVIDSLNDPLTDPLTRLHNRRHVIAQLNELLDNARHMRYPLTVAALDLDHFQGINDRHGHAVGDQVLMHFARQLKKHLRPRDVAGRVGGEEFLILLPNAEVGGADQAVNRLRSLIQETAPVDGMDGLRYGFSAGLTQAQPADTIELLCQRADRALHLAKHAGRGRNQVIDGAAEYAFGAEH